MNSNTTKNHLDPLYVCFVGKAGGQWDGRKQGGRYQTRPQILDIINEEYTICVSIIPCSLPCYIRLLSKKSIDQTKNMTNVTINCVKFKYFEKATKFCEISTVDLTGSTWTTYIRYGKIQGQWALKKAKERPCISPYLTLEIKPCGLKFENSRCLFLEL